jgi:cellulose synthase/poly-beta-1,6-N-acetylglucosamine synthase-like glycosyltransferase
LIYGSTTEDVLTGMKIHGRGWRSVQYSPRERPAFLGSFPTAIEDILKMRRRWSTGFLEILLGADSPLTAFWASSAKLSLMQRLLYIYAVTSMSAVIAIPMTVYALLPAASLLLARPLYPTTLLSVT